MFYFFREFILPASDLTWNTSQGFNFPKLHALMYVLIILYVGTIKPTYACKIFT